jgi:L-amino acid N-acyltransferase YncA
MSAEGFTVRRFTSSDRNALLQFYASLTPAALKWTMAPYPQPLVERWMENLQNIEPYAAFYNDILVAWAWSEAKRHPRMRGVAEVNIHMQAGYRTPGLARELLTQVVENAGKTGVHRLERLCAEEDLFTIELHTALGFRVEGHLKDAYYGDDGRYHDAVVLGYLFELPPPL